MIYVFLILFFYIPFFVNGNIIEIPEIIVSASRTEQTAKTAVTTVNVISESDINRTSVRSFDQIIESISGITINRSAGIATNSISIRGSSDVLGGGVGNRTLLLIDGRPAITADTGGENWSLIPLDIIERVEVVKGALSPLYGSNAMGGIINIITKSPSIDRKINFNISGGYFERPPKWMRYTDKRSYFGDIGLTHSSTYKKVGYIYSLGGSMSDGHRQNTDFSLYNAYGKIQYHDPKNIKLNLSLARTSMERGYPYPWLIDNNPPYVHPLKIAKSKTNDRQEKQLWNIDLSLKSIISAQTKFASSFYYFGNYSKSVFNPDNLIDDDRPYLFFSDSDAKKIGGIVQMDVYLPINYLIFGLDVQLDSVDSNPPELMFGKHRSKNLAGFIQDKLNFNESTELLLGMRYDYRNIDDLSGEGQLNPKLGLSYMIDDNTSLRLSVGQAFRSPSLAELYIRQEINSGIKFIENPQLKAEKLKFYAEAGIRKIFLKLFENDTSIFLYKYSDMIVWQSLSEGEYQVTNLNRSMIRGLETSIKFNCQNLYISTNYTFTDALDQTNNRENDTLPYKPKHTAYISLNFLIKHLESNLSIKYVSDIEEAMFYPNDAPKAFYVINTKASYYIKDGLYLSFSINNLLDHQYEEMARYRMPGRSYFFKLSYTTL